MEVRRLIRKPLQPARPIRRTIPGNGAVLMVNFQAKFTDHCRDRLKDHYDVWCSIGNLHDVFKDPVTEKPAVNKTKERITYTRDVLMQLSSLPVSKQKPDYLPDLPIILKHPVSSLHCAIDPFLPGYVQNIHPAARLDHHS